MSMKVLSITVLLLLAFTASSVNSYLIRRPPPQCCNPVTERAISNYNLLSTYRYLPAHFPCMAIIMLKTQQGEVCVNPNAEWVKTLIDNMKTV